MGTVSNHQLSTFTTPVNGTSPIDANQVKGNDNSIKTAYNAHDADTTIHLQSGAVATRPAASTAGQTWLATDSSAVYLWLDNGSTWVEANYLRNTGGSVTGAVTISDTTQSTSTTTGALIVSGGVGVAKNVNVGGTLGVTGVATLTAQPILSSLTASQAVFSDGSKGLVSNPITGTGNVVMSASPTLTGTIGAASMTLTGTLGVTGVATFTAQPIVSSLTASSAVATDASKGLVSVANTGSGNNVLATAPTLTTVTVSSGGINVTGNSTITGTLGGLTTVTATTFAGALTGNADTATKLATARTINGVSFDGSANITVTAAAGTLTGTTLNSTVVSSSLTSIGTLASGAVPASLVTAGTFGAGTFAFQGDLSFGTNLTSGTNGNITTSAGYLVVNPVGNLYLRAQGSSTINIADTASNNVTICAGGGTMTYQGVTPTNTNTANALVLRNANGDFAGRNVTVAAILATTGGAVVQATNNITTTAGDFVVSTAGLGILNGSSARAISIGSGATPTTTVNYNLSVSNNLLATIDATYDIGASGATRFRDFYLSRNATIGGTLGVTGNVGIGVAAGSKLLTVQSGSAITTPGFYTRFVFSADNATANDLEMMAPATSQSRITFSNGTNSSDGELGYNHNTRSMRIVAGGNATVTVTATGVTNSGTLNVSGNPTAGTDATYDIGASGATRFRDFYLSRNATIGGTLGVTGDSTISSMLTISRGSSTALDVSAGGNAYFGGGLLLGKAGNTSAVIRSGNGIAIANGASAKITDNSYGNQGVGIMMVFTNYAEVALIACTGFGNALTFIYNDGNFSLSAGTASKLNITGSGGTQFNCENNRGASRNVYCIPFSQ